MRGRDFERLARQYVMPQFPALRLSRTVVYAEATNFLLRGFALDSSAFEAQAFALNCFIQPLAVPADGLRMPYVFRLRDTRNNRDWWDLSKQSEPDVFASVVDAVKAQYLPMLDDYTEPWELMRWPNAWNGIHMVEGAAYGLVLKGDVSSARKWLGRAEQLGRQDGREWGVQIADRAAVVLGALDRTSAEAADLLRKWASETSVRVRADIGGKDPLATI